MAISVVTAHPESFLEEIRFLISSNEIDTWIVDEDGDFTYKSSEWNKVAWFHPFVLNSRVVFGIIGRKGFTISAEEYGAYHGFFIEMLVTHYISKVESISIIKPGNDNIFDRIK